MVETLSLGALKRYPFLAYSMFEDRAEQFQKRLDWSVSVNPLGHEFDEYDDDKCTYVVAHDKHTDHLGSLRLRDVDDGCMLIEKFGSLLVKSEPLEGKVLEVTRYCVSPRLNGSHDGINRRLFETAITFAYRNNYDCWVGVFDQRMLNIYRRNKWPLEQMSSVTVDGKTICLGRWVVEKFQGENRLNPVNYKSPQLMQVNV